MQEIKVSKKEETENKEENLEDKAARIFGHRECTQRLKDTIQLILDGRRPKSGNCNILTN